MTTTFFPFPEDLQVRVCRETFTFTELQKREMDRIWDVENKKREVPLENRPLFVLDDHSEKRVRGSFVDYKAYLGCRVHPEWEMSLCPVGVTGVVRWKGKVLLGKRSEFVTHYPGYWELVPAGSLDKDCLEEGVLLPQKQLLQELKEETGIGEQEISTIRPLTLMLDEKEVIFDLCYDVELKEGREEKKFISSLREVTEFRWVEKGEWVNGGLEGVSVIPACLSLISSIK